MSEVMSAGAANVLLIERQGAAQSILRRILDSQDYTCTTAADVDDAERALAHEHYDVVLCSLDEIGVGGVRRLHSESSQELGTEIVAITDQAHVEDAVEVTRLGGFGYITRPLDADEVVQVMRQATRRSQSRRPLTADDSGAQARIRARLVGRSGALERMFELVERVARTRASVLILGETGTGKELVARSIHELSDRANGPFVPVNCSALPETLLESELFGHVKGSFTGAIAHRRGLFEEASGGTLFLDEIGTLSQAIQVKLLRVLQDRKIQRLGSGMPVFTDFRLIVATNTDLEKEVAARRFREDLYYRLNVFPIRVPTLRERRDDIPLLIEHFRKRCSRENRVRAPIITAETTARLRAYDWPGNVRELEHYVERVVIMYAGAPNVPFEHPSGWVASEERALLQQARDNQWDLSRLEREYILDVLQSSGGRRAEAAAILGIDRRTLYRKLKEYGAMDTLNAEPAELD